MCHISEVDLTLPLSTIAPSLEAEALTVLARTEQPLTGRQVAALARRGSHTAIRLVLERLREDGLVEMASAGRAYTYKLNREHLLADAVLLAVSARERLLVRLRNSIQDWQVPAEHASLFGSLARGEAHSGSDIDILVVRPPGELGESRMWQDQLQALEAQVLSWTGNPLSWFETDRSTLHEASSEPVMDSWRRDAVHLAGERLDSVLAETAR